MTHAPQQDRPPLQLQTLHGRSATYGSMFSAVAVGVALALNASSTYGSDVLWTSDFLRVVAAIVLFRVAVGLWSLRVCGLYLLPDGTLVSRGLFSSRATEPAPALSVMSLRPLASEMRLLLRAKPTGPALQDVPGFRRVMRRQLWLNWTAGRTNDVLIRDASAKGPWESTGIHWTDADDAFLDAFTASVDALTGQQTTPANPADAPALRVRPEPQFRTTHATLTRHGLPWRFVSTALGIAGLLFVPFVFVEDLRFFALLSIPCLVLWMRFLSRSHEHAVSLPGNHRLNSWSPLGIAAVVDPVAFDVVDHRAGVVISAVNPKGRKIQLPALLHHPGLRQPNELLVRFPDAPHETASRWHGTGVYWGDTGEPVRQYLQEALRS